MKLTEYVPELVVVAGFIVGFCVVEVKLAGPDHEYVEPATQLELKFSTPLLQTGELLLARGVA